MPQRLRSRTKIILVAVSGVLLAVVGTMVVVSVTGGDSNVVWSDEFEGPRYAAADPKNWVPALGGDGWGNQELECYTDSRYNSALDGDGNLVITARHQPGHNCSGGTTNDYTSARLRTEGLRTVGLGKVRIRAKMPTAAGVWPAAWALGDNHATDGWPKSGEIDIVEVVGSQPTTVHQTVHFPNPQGGPTSITHTVDVPSIPDYAWHVYGIDRTADSITYTVDDKVTKRITRDQVAAKGQWVFTRPFYLLLNVAVGGTFPGPPKSGQDYPQRMVVDYVRVYR